MERSRVVLLVNADERAAAQLHRWLTDDGSTVLACTGPHAPSYECAGWKDQDCPLVDASDVVVLDLRLDTDTMMEGPPGWQLLFLYRSRGKPVIALSDPEDALEIIRDPHVVVLPRRPDRRVLLSTIRDLTGADAGLPSRSSVTLPAGDGEAGSRPGSTEARPVADFADLWL